MALLATLRYSTYSFHWFATLQQTYFGGRHNTSESIHSDHCMETYWFLNAIPSHWLVAEGTPCSFTFASCSAQP